MSSYYKWLKIKIKGGYIKLTIKQSLLLMKIKSKENEK